MPLTRPISAGAVLVSHPASPCQVIHRIDARVDGGEYGALTFSHNLVADIHQLLVPVAAAPRRVDGLWRHTCFEAFFALKDDPVYYEFNFSPSREWAAYRFHGYRRGEPIDDDVLVRNISVEQEADWLALTAKIRLDRLPPIQSGMTLRIGLAAVIEGHDGTLSYWALRHPTGKPDFHHPDSFVLELALPNQRA